MPRGRRSTQRHLNHSRCVTEVLCKRGIIMAPTHGAALRIAFELGVPADGGSLYLQATKTASGRLNWLHRYAVERRERQRGLGSGGQGLMRPGAPAEWQGHPHAEAVFNP
jgi:hypothetical protein